MSEDFFNKDELFNENKNIDNTEVVSVEVIHDDVFNSTIDSMDDDDDDNIFIPRSVEEYVKQNKDILTQDDYNKITDFDVMIDDLDKIHARRMNKLLGTMSNSDFAKNYMKLIEFKRGKAKSFEPILNIPVQLTKIEINIVK